MVDVGDKGHLDRLLKDYTNKTPKSCDRCGRGIAKTSRVNKHNLYLCSECTPYRNDYLRNLK